jgi:hypothetical protein
LNTSCVPTPRFADHRNLLTLTRGSAKVTRWKLAIQEFDFLIEHIPGPDNIIADAMSRLCPDSTDSAAAPINSHQIALCMAVFDDAHRVHCNARTAGRQQSPRNLICQLGDAARHPLEVSQQHCGSFWRGTHMPVD